MQRREFGRLLGVLGASGAGAGAALARGAAGTAAPTLARGIGALAGAATGAAVADGVARSSGVLSAFTDAVDPRIVGLWSRHEARHSGAQVGFYYFGPHGQGLVRYGHVGHNQTHSFSFEATPLLASADVVHRLRLKLRYRKLGVQRETVVGLTLGQPGEPPTLHFEREPWPFEPAPAAAAHRHVPPPPTLSDRLLAADGAPSGECELGALDPAAMHAIRALGGPLALESVPCGVEASGSVSGSGGESADDVRPVPLDGQMWVDWQDHVTGGGGFSMYQFAPAALDGRGVGFHHVGDFDDWTTQTLEYRVISQGPPPRHPDGRTPHGTLELRFHAQHATGPRAVFSPFALAPVPAPGDRAHDARRPALWLASDPTSFGRARTYAHMGRSF